MCLRLPWAHVFKHQLLKRLTTKYLKRQSLLTKSTEGKYKSFKWNTGCLQLQCHTDTLAVLSRDYLHISIQSKQTDRNTHAWDSGVSEEHDERKMTSTIYEHLSLRPSSLWRLQSNTSRLCRSYFKTQANTANCCRNTFNFMQKLYT